MTIRPMDPRRARVARAGQRMAPGGRRWSESPIPRMGRRRTLSVGPGGFEPPSTVDSALHGHTADNVTLTTAYNVLTVADALHGHTASQAVLVPGDPVTLVVSDAQHAHSAANVFLAKPTLIQFKTYTSGDSTPTGHTITFDAAPASGSDVVVVVGRYNLTSVTGVSGLGATWSQVGSVLGDQLYGFVWVGRGCNGTDTDITVSGVAADRQGSCAWEFDYVPPTAGTPSTYAVDDQSDWGPSGVSAGPGNLVVGFWQAGVSPSQPAFTFTDYPVGGEAWAGGYDVLFRSIDRCRLSPAWVAPDVSGTWTRTVAVSGGGTGKNDIALVVAFT